MSETDKAEKPPKGLYQVLINNGNDGGATITDFSELAAIAERWVEPDGVTLKITRLIGVL